MAPTGKVLLVFGLLLTGLILEFGGQVQSGELAEARAQVVAMLNEVKPELRSRQQTRQIYKELKAKPKRDFYEETLFRQLDEWVKEPGFQKPKAPMLVANRTPSTNLATKVKAPRKNQRLKKKSLVKVSPPKTKAPSKRSPFSKTKPKKLA